MTDQAKNSRRIAKGNYTRKRNILIKSIETSQGIEVVETNYAKLVDTWQELERKHLEYVNLLTDEHLVDEEELWMTEVEEKYSNAFNRKVKYVENVTESEKATREHATRQEAIDNAKVKRNTARAVFEASYQSSSIVVGVTSAVFKIGSKFLIKIFFRTFYKNGFSELVKILVIILVFRIGFNAFHKNGFYDEKNFNFLIP